MVLLSLKNHHSKLMNRYIEDYTKGDDYDCILICDGSEIKCHRFVLKTFSNYFRSTFDNQLVLRYLSQRCPPFVLLVVNMSYASLKALIDFMYFGKMKLNRKEIKETLKSAKILGLTDFDLNKKSKEDKKFRSNQDQTDCSSHFMMNKNHKDETTLTQINGHSSNNLNINHDHDFNPLTGQDSKENVVTATFKLPPPVPKSMKKMIQKETTCESKNEECMQELFLSLSHSSFSSSSSSSSSSTSTSISSSSTSSSLSSPSSASSIRTHNTSETEKMVVKSYSSHDLSPNMNSNDVNEKVCYRCSLPEEAIKSSSRPLQFCSSSTKSNFSAKTDNNLITENIPNSANFGDNLDGNVTRLSSELSSTEFELAPTDLPDMIDNEICTQIKIPPPFIPDVEYHCCLVCHLVDPSEFYVHLLTEETSQLDDIQEQLAQYYPEFSASFDLPTHPNDFIGSCWAAIHPSDNLWYRVKVLEVAEHEPSEDIKKVKILVQYVDYGNTEELTVEDLRPLCSDIAELPALAVRCSLFNIQPIGENWSFESNEGFHKLSGFDREKTVTIYVTEKPLTNNFESPLSVYLWNSDLTLGEGKDILVNAALVRKNLAKTENTDWINEAEKTSLSEKCVAFKMSSTFSHTSNELSKSEEALESAVSVDEKVSNWDPLYEDYTSPLNVCNYNPDDTGIASVGYKFKSEAGICRYFLQGNCKFGDRCYNKHLTPQKGKLFD